MEKWQLIDLYFVNGTGAMFKIDYKSTLVKCFVRDDNAFFQQRGGAGGRFVDNVALYQKLLAEAAAINIARTGISDDIVGNIITADDIEMAQFSYMGQSSYIPDAL